MEHERQHLKRFPANTLLPWVPKALCYYFQSFAFGDFCSEVRGLCCDTNAEPLRHLAESRQKCFHGTQLKVIWTTQYKISPPGTEPPWHVSVWVPFCHQCSFTSLPRCHMHKRGWLDGFFSFFLLVSSSGRSASTCRGKRRGVVMAEVGSVVRSLKGSGAARLWWLHGSPRFGLMAPHGPTYCWWSDGLLRYEATGPGAHFHIHFSLSLSKTLNDFPNIG